MGRLEHDHPVPAGLRPTGRPGVFDTGDAAGQMPLAVHGAGRDELCEPPLETPAIGQVPKRPVEARRRNLERVRVLERELDIEHGADILAHPLAIVDTDRLVARAVFRTGVPRRSVDDDPNDPPDRLAPQLNVEDLQPVVASHAIGDRPDLSQPIFLTHGEHRIVQRPEKQKVGKTPTFAGLGVNVPDSI